MTKARVLVAGVGNIFLTDDGFGVEVVRRLAAEPLPPGARVHDYGIGGIHLAYDLLDGYETLVLVDAVSRGEEPGTVFVLEVGRNDLGPGGLDAHDMDPAAVFAALDRLGGTLPRTLVVGCEPAETGEGLGLSDPVGRAVDHAVAAVRDLVAQQLAAPVPPVPTSTR